jgi:hypothetical protein
LSACKKLEPRRVLVGVIELFVQSITMTGSYHTNKEAGAGTSNRRHAGRFEFFRVIDGVISGTFWDTAMSGY